jgi:hypothetical protein
MKRRRLRTQICPHTHSTRCCARARAYAASTFTFIFIPALVPGLDVAEIGFAGVQHLCAYLP